MTEYTETVKLWRERAYFLRESDQHDPLSKKIYAHIRNCKEKQEVTIALTVEELETILEL